MPVGMPEMHVAELWRYPVKSLRGERLEAAEVRRDGIVGDRSLVVRDGRGNLITARTRPALLSLNAVAAPSGEVTVAGDAWDAEPVGAAVREAAGPDARLERADGDRFDDTPLLVATDGCAGALGIDHRRLRPNILIAGAAGMAERGWPGRVLRCGEVEIEVEKLCKRCVITTIDPDTLEGDPRVLERINREWDGRVALNCYVRRPGRVAVGDPVTLVEREASPCAHIR